MRPRQGNSNRAPEETLDELRTQLADYVARRDVGSLRELIVMIVGLEKTVRRLGRAVAVAEGLSATSARDRIRGYFAAFPNQVIEGIELAAVSGIAQYARRIRELRQEGFEVKTGPDAMDPASGKELRTDQYLYSPPVSAARPIRT